MREVITRSRPTPRVVAVCIALGLCLRRGDHDTPRTHAAARELARLIRAAPLAGLVVCITGPSGGGKSTLLRALARRLR